MCTDDTHSQAPQGRRTPKPAGSSSDCGQRASVLECGGPPPLSMGARNRNSCGSWKAPFRFFECIGTMNRVTPLGAPASCRRVAASGWRGRTGRRDAGAPRPSSWRAPYGFDAVHWDPEPADRAVASWTAPILWRFRLARPSTPLVQGDKVTS